MYVYVGTCGAWAISPSLFFKNKHHPFWWRWSPISLLGRDVVELLHSTPRDCANCYRGSRHENLPVALKSLTSPRASIWHCCCSQTTILTLSSPVQKAQLYTPTMRPYLRLTQVNIIINIIHIPKYNISFLLTYETKTQVPKLLMTSCLAVSVLRS